MPVQGFVRARKHQLVRQSQMGTVVNPATRVYPFQGVPNVNRNWTNPDVDTGSIVRNVAPYLGPGDYTFPSTCPAVDYDTVPALMAAMFGGHETPTPIVGDAVEWTHFPSAVAPLDPNDLFTYEWGDDVVEDWYQFGSGLLESLTITGPEGLGACSASMSWRFASAASTGSSDNGVTGTVPTPDLSIDKNPVYLYLKDMGIYITDAEESGGTGQILNALHNFVLTITAETDLKRFANASQSFDINEYGRTSYVVSLAATFAKTEDTVGTGSESDAWMSDDAVNRFIRLQFTSTADAGTATPYSWNIAFPAWYSTRDDGESGGNTTVTLTAEAYYDAEGFGGFFSSDVVCQLSDAELGTIAS